MPEPVAHLFVYGTLKRGGPAAARQALADGARFLAEASIAGRLYLADGYPAAVAGADHERVHGEIFTLVHAAETLAALDAYEGPGYERRAVAVPCQALKSEVLCWAYFWTGPVDPATRIHSGLYQP